MVFILNTSAVQAMDLSATFVVVSKGKQLWNYCNKRSALRKQCWSKYKSEYKMSVCPQYKEKDV